MTPPIIRRMSTAPIVRTPISRRACIAALAVLLSSLACDGGTHDSRTTSDSASATARTVDSLVARSANRVMYMDGDERSVLEFTRRPDGALEVTQEATFGDDGKATRRYTFDKEGRLLGMTEERSQTAAAGNQSPALMRSTLSVFIESGVPTTSKTVDGKPGVVQPFEVDNVTRRAEAIRRLAPTSAHP